MGDKTLKIDNLHVSYGSIRAVRGISIEVNEGETVALLGANSAGKTTTMRAVSNLVKWTTGAILYRGTALRGMPPHQIARMGVLHIPEGRGIFGQLTVEENLQVAHSVRPAAQPLDQMCREVWRRFPNLRERFRQPAGRLSGGEQQMLALARAMVNPPALLLIDEPSLGLSPRLTAEAFSVIREFQTNGMTILLVEQNAREALKVAHRGYILRHGQVVLEGTTAELVAQPDMLGNYLGAS